MRAHSNTDLLSKSMFECAHTRFFFKPQSLTSGSLSAPWDTRMYSTSFERSTNFLQYKILKEWIEALLKWFMLCQSSLISLHKMAFQPFWLPVTVHQLLYYFHKNVEVLQSLTPNPFLILNFNKIWIFRCHDYFILKIFSERRRYKVFILIKSLLCGF